MAYEAVTTETDVSVNDFLSTVDHAGRVEDCRAVMELMAEVTGLEPRMWGPSIIGYGSYDYTYDSGHSGRSLVIGLSPRKANLVLYIMPGVKSYPELLDQLGKHKTGVSCLYLGRIKNIDMAVLKQLIAGAVESMKRRFPDCIATAKDLD